MEHPGTEDFARRAKALDLPRPWQLPAGTLAPNVRLVRVIGRRAIIAGHNAIDKNGNVAGPFGIVGDGLSLEEAQTSCIAVMKAVLASLQQELGDLSRIANWVKLEGWVNSKSGFKELPAIMNPASEIIYDLFGANAGAHSRYVVGVTGLPFGAPVELAGEVELVE